MDHDRIDARRRNSPPRWAAPPSRRREVAHATLELAVFLFVTVSWVALLYLAGSSR